MKIKNILLGVLFGLVGFGAVYATLAPNIAGRPTITSANPNNYYTIIQSGTTQGKISMANFANSISGALGLSGFLTGFTETDPVAMPIINTQSGTWNYFMNNSGNYLTGGAIIGSEGYFAMYSGNKLSQAQIFMTGNNLYSIGNNLYSSNSFTLNNVAIGFNNSIASRAGVSNSLILSNASALPRGSYLTIVGGGNHVIGSDDAPTTYSTIIGGISNSMNYGSDYSIIIGNNSRVNSDYGIAMGKYAKVSNNNSFVYSDGLYHTSEEYTRTKPSGTFSVFATGGTNLWGGLKVDTSVGGGNTILLGNIGKTLTGIIAMKDNFVYNNTGTFNANITGAFYVNAYGGMRVGGGLYDIAGNAYITGSYIPSTYLATGFTYPGSDSYVPSTKAVADYIEAMALNLGDVITTGGFYISGASTARRTVETGSRYRIEYATGLLGPRITAGMLDNGGTHNTTFGVGAGRDITAGIFNTFIGHEAGRFTTNGNRNTAIGGYAMRDLTNGTDNTCMGIYCMQNMETGKYNTSMGDESLWSNKTGNNNVAIGMGAGEYAMGSNNVFIGRFADITGYTYLNNSIALGDRALVWTSAMMQIGNTGLNFISTRAKLGIGVQFPTNALSVSGSIDIPATEWMYFGTGRRIGTSGSNLSIQAYTGGNRVEKSVFIP